MHGLHQVEIVYFILFFISYNTHRKQQSPTGRKHKWKHSRGNIRKKLVSARERKECTKRGRKDKKRGGGQVTWIKFTYSIRMTNSYILTEQLNMHEKPDAKYISIMTAGENNYVIHNLNTYTWIDSFDKPNKRKYSYGNFSG